MEPNQPTTQAPIESCGDPTCDRRAGELFCGRCSTNLEAIARALEAEGIELRPDPSAQQ